MDMSVEPGEPSPKCQTVIVAIPSYSTTEGPQKQAGTEAVYIPMR